MNQTRNRNTRRNWNNKQQTWNWQPGPSSWLHSTDNYLATDWSKTALHTVPVFLSVDSL